MTISNQTILRNDYIANGTNTIFAFNFPIFYEPSEVIKFSIQVIITNELGVETIKTENTDYTITYNTLNIDNNVINQGNVVFTTAPANLYKVSLLRKLNLTQNTNLTNKGTDKFSGANVEASLDKLTLINLENKEIFNRCVLLPKSSSLTNIEFPIDLDRADQAVVINAAGNNLTTKNLADINLATLTNFAKTLMDDNDASEARATLNAQELNANLTALSNLTGASNKLPYFTGVGTMAVRDLLATNAIQGISYLQPSRNILINGAMAIDQRNNGSSQTITAGGALAYTIDRWYAYCTGANVTGQRVVGTAPNAFNYRFTGAASVTKIGFAQRIEALNSQHLAGRTVALSVDLANSVLTTVTWTAWYANSTDSFGTLASPTRTQIATGTFTVNSTITRYSTSITIPSNATTGIEIEFSVGAQTSGTWTIGRAQLENTPEQTVFDDRLVQQELLFCQKYYEYGITYGISYNSSGAQIQRCLYPFKVTKRTAAPSATLNVLSGSLTSPASANINSYNLWIAFSSASGGLDGSFGVAISDEL